MKCIFCLEKLITWSRNKRHYIHNEDGTCIQPTVYKLESRSFNDYVASLYMTAVDLCNSDIIELYKPCSMYGPVIYCLKEHKCDPINVSSA
jgi:hypothetical protein